MENKMSLDEARSHETDVTERIRSLAAEYEGREFSPDAAETFEALKDEREKIRKFIGEQEQRLAYLDSLADRDQNTESEPKFSFQVRKSSAVPEDPTRLEEYRTRSTSIEGYEQALRDGAHQIIEGSYKPSLQLRGIDREDAQGDASKLANLDVEMAKRFIFTSTPGYKREWAQYVQTGIVGPELQRTASLTTTAGGYAVPVELDTTLLLTNAGVVNPVRGISRVRQTNVNTVEFINTAGITAGFGAEATEASDNAPVLAQPTVNLEKAFAFVPMSIEIAQDWAAIQEDMAMAFADAKNQLESSKFLTGTGHSNHEPQGLIAAGGATAITTTATTAVVAVADLFSLEIALSPRYRQNASIVGNKAVYQKIRQFASNGVNIWVQLQGALPPELIGYPAYEWSSYSSGVTTSASTVLTIGDFNYFAIVDRAGMNVEYIPHLFGGSSRYPTGQRGLYMWWRTSSQVLSPTLGSQSAFQSLKVL